LYLLFTTGLRQGLQRYPPEHNISLRHIVKGHTSTMEVFDFWNTILWGSVDGV